MGLYKVIAIIAFMFFRMINKEIFKTQENKFKKFLIPFIVITGVLFFLILILINPETPPEPNIMHIKPKVLNFASIYYAVFTGYMVSLFHLAFLIVKGLFTKKNKLSKIE
ncbi:TPA: hypothetical protein DCR49_03535 [Candidatus Delongbacteria bacterium]|nr:hypothetical protein [Candidatus Delongbacteria bacterium]